MAKTRMPRDDNSQSIPVLRFRTGGAQQLSTSAVAIAGLIPSVRLKIAPFV